MRSFPVIMLPVDHQVMKEEVKEQRVMITHLLDETAGDSKEFKWIGIEDKRWDKVIDEHRLNVDVVYLGPIHCMGINNRIFRISTRSAMSNNEPATTQYIAKGYFESEELC